MGDGQSPVEGVEVSDFWQDRPTFVTGGTGLVGGWLVRRLVDAGADVVCLVRDWVPQSRAVREAVFRSVKVVRGDLRDQACSSACWASTRSTRCSTSPRRRSSRSPTAIRRLTFETNIARHVGAARGVPPQPDRQADRDGVIGQGVWRTRETSLRRSRHRCAGTHPYDVSKSCARSDLAGIRDDVGCPVTITRCGNFYGGGDLNWNRIVPGTIRSVLRGQRAGHSLGRPVHPRLLLRGGRRGRLHAARGEDGREPGAGGESFNFSNELQITVLDLVRTHPRS